MSQTFTTLLPPKSQGRLQVLALILGIEAMVLCLPAVWWMYVGLALSCVGIAFMLVCSVIYARASGVLLSWMLIFPLGYYYASFPKAQPIFTLDRAFIVVLLVAAAFAGSQGVLHIHKDIHKAAIWWVAFLVVAGITLPRTKSPLGGLRVIVDGFCLPGILAWFVLRWIDVRKHLSALHVVACLMSIYIAGIGLAEVVMQRDLLVLPESAVILAGNVNEDAAQIWVRPNGPFATTNSYALIGLVSVLLLLFLRNALQGHLPRWQWCLHRLGVAAALLTSFLPLFRSVLTSLIVIGVIDAFYNKGIRRLLRVGALCSFFLVVLLMQLALPQILEDRTDPENVFGRIAEQRQIVSMFMDNPIGGVGLNNFHDAAQKGKYVAYYQGVESVDYPHNNLGAILVETGLSGVVPFIASQFFLVLAFRRLCHDRSQTLAWKFFLFIFLAYWINGMSLASAYYSDLNLWYMLALAILYKFAATSKGPEAGSIAHPANPSNA